MTPKQLKVRKYWKKRTYDTDEVSFLKGLDEEVGMKHPEVIYHGAIIDESEDIMDYASCKLRGVSL